MTNHPFNHYNYFHNIVHHNI